MHAVGVGDLPRGEAERRLNLPDAPDAGGEAEPLEVDDRGHRTLLAAHGEMGEAFEAREHAAVFLCEIEQREEHRLGGPGDDTAPECTI